MTDFFTEEELALHKSIAGKKIDFSSPVHEFNKQEMTRLLGKVDSWSKRCANRCTENFFPLSRDKSKTNMQTAYNHISVYALYFWRRLYPYGVTTNQVFFQVSVGLKEEDGLIIQIGYNYDDRFTTLTKEQRAEMKRLKEEHPEWYERIPASKLKGEGWNWDKLTEKSVVFFEKFKDDYLAVQKHIMNFGTPAAQPFMTPSRSKISPRKAAEDYLKLKEIGDGGEAFVIQEIEKSLQEKGVANPIIHSVLHENGVQDGDGFDIKYQDEKGNFHYVEVKTTTGNFNTPIYFTGPELAFAEEHPENFQIYRIYNFNKKEGTGELKVLSLSEAQGAFNFAPLLFYCKPN